MTRYVKFMRGTTTAYNKLTEKDDDTLYFLSDSINEEGSLYLGNKLISGPSSGIITPETMKLTDLIDVFVAKDLNYDALLMFNTKTSQWEAYSFDALKFTGATSTLAGLSGLVPAPEVGQTNLFLRSDGTWAEAGTRGLVFETETGVNESHNDAITRIIGDSIINSGDIAIIKDFIAKDKNNNSKYQYTSYVYDGSKWTAMDGNYNAENVYFKNNLIFTEPVGTITIPNTGSATVAAEGKNVKQLMEFIFAQEKDPVITQPSVNLTVIPKIVKSEDEVEIGTSMSYEVGTKIIPSYITSLNPGSYTYGPETGIIATSYSIIATGVETPLTTNKGEFEQITIDDNTSYYITSTIGHTIGKVPVTNLNNVADGQIQVGSVSTTSTELKGYRAFFYGMDASNVELTSDFIRNNLINGGAYDGQKILTFTAADLANVKRFIVAVPNDSTRSGLVSATITSSMNANALHDYKQLDNTIKVAGINNYTEAEYKIWIYQPASIADTEVHTVVLS